MLQLFSTIRKELRILFRDAGGLAIMFLMPMAMITIMALIQDAPFRDYQELKIPLLLINKDSGDLSRSIENGIAGSKIFQVSKFGGEENEAQEKINKGEYQVGILIPQGTSERFHKKIDRFVSEKLAGTMGTEATKDSFPSVDSILNITIYFAPDIKKSFRASVMASVHEFTSRLETQSLLDYFRKSLNKPGDSSVKETEPLQSFIQFKEEIASGNNDPTFEINSVQHNVPAWTLFGMFFIVISMAGSLIKERDDGSYLRMLTMPGSYVNVLAGKITAYLFICLLQCVLMLMVGIYLMPWIGLPKLLIGSNIAAIGIIALCSGLAATGYGILVGTIFTTHQQASTFGAISVVILAALGGIWVPVYVMPQAVRTMAEFSPLYWGLHAFQSIFIHDGTIRSILTDATKLLLFFIFTAGLAHIWNKVVSG
jgi:ABC-2 type transport system permease protein